jgi:hypothetical protein
MPPYYLVPPVAQLDCEGLAVSADLVEHALIRESRLPVRDLPANSKLHSTNQRFNTRVPKKTLVELPGAGIHGKRFRSAKDCEADEVGRVRKEARQT